MASEEQIFNHPALGPNMGQLRSFGYTCEQSSSYGRAVNGNNEDQAGSSYGRGINTNIDETSNSDEHTVSAEQLSAIPTGPG